MRFSHWVCEYEYSARQANSLYNYLFKINQRVNLLTIFVDLIMAVGVGITISSIMAVYQVSRNTQIKVARSKVAFDIDIQNENIHILKVNGSLFFGTASTLEDKLEKLKDSKKIIQ